MPPADLGPGFGFGPDGPLARRDLVVRGGHVLVDGGWRRADVTVRDGVVAAIEPSTPASAGSPPGDGGADEAGVGVGVVDATGMVVAPGFVDLQLNGAGGVDLTATPERLWEVAALLPRWGVTSWLPTIVTSPEPVRERALAVLHEGPPDDAVVATPLGLHFEGPFLDPRRKGAHAEEHLRVANVDVVAHWSRDGGVALVTLAPDLPGALDVTRALVGRGVVVSMGHSSATAAEAEAGVDAGARWATHLFNTMPPLHHRDPGLAGVALTDERLHVGLIADGLHVHPRMVALAARALGPRLTLVTDAVAALGMPPGPVRLGDREALAGDDGVRLPDGTLAGSNLSMDTAVANLMAYAGVDLATALHAATVAPARLLGRADLGVLRPGAPADLVVLETSLVPDVAAGRPRLRVAATVVGGRVVTREASWRS